jgi:RNA polymerase sigma-70 factor (ECF subfamily)
MLRKQTEAELVQAAARGDGEAYEQLVRKYQDRLFTTVMHMVRRRVEAEDIVQDAFLQAYANLPAFQGKCGFYTWLYRIAMNLALSRRRRARPVFSLEENREAIGEEPADRGEAPPDKMVREERLAEIQAAVANLDADQRAVLVLRAVEGFDYRTIGLVLGLNVGTVRSRLHRARMKVRSALQAANA